MPGFFDFLAPQKRLLQQQREITRLARKVSELRTQNESMRQGMRRCVSCEYRIDFKQRQGGADIKPD